MFEMPATFEGLDLDALRALSEQAMEEASALMAKDDADLTDEDITRAETLMGNSAALDAEAEARETADAERAARIAGLRSQAARPNPETEPVPGQDPAEDPDEDPAGDEDDESDPTQNRKEVVVASAPAPKPARRTVAIAQRNAPDVVVPKTPGAVLVAAADVPGFSNSQELDSFDQVAEAFLARARSFTGGKMGGQKQMNPGVYGLSAKAQRYGVARIQKPENQFTTGMDAPLEDQFRTIMDAAKESRLPGGSLSTTSARWKPAPVCSPSPRSRLAAVASTSPRDPTSPRSWLTPTSASRSPRRRSRLARSSPATPSSARRSRKSVWT